MNIRSLLAWLNPQERRQLGRAYGAMLTSSTLNLAGPALAGYAIDHYVVAQNSLKLAQTCGLLLLLYGLASFSQWLQTLWMGSLGQGILLRLRGQLFHKLQQLPLSFFQAQQAGDLISRLNSDTERINTFFSQSLVQLASSSLGVIGAALWLLYLSPTLGLLALLPASLLLLFSRLLTTWVRSRQAQALAGAAQFSAQAADLLQHFRALVAYDCRDYFRQQLLACNQECYAKSLRASQAQQLLLPCYSLGQQAAQALVLLYGLVLVQRGQLSLGTLISLLTYVGRFYDPLRQIAALWNIFQTALAAWERVTQILQEPSSLPQLRDHKIQGALLASPLLEFQQVDFGYVPGHLVIQGLNLRLEAGRSYALVGPTGGGKSTIASLMARLYDPNSGCIRLGGRDLRCYSPEERAQRIGYLLQDPFLLSGSLGDNLRFGLPPEVTVEWWPELTSLFPQGLETDVAGLSLGQKQVVAFWRALLRQPELLILDEASANLDSQTEALLQRMLLRLPQGTTKVIIAHRLHTIANAQEIYFVSPGQVIKAGSMEQALNLLHQVASVS